MASSSILLTCLVLAAILSPAAADLTALTTNINVLVRKLLNLLTGYLKGPLAWLVDIIPESMKALAAPILNPEGMAMMLKGPAKTGFQQLLGFFAPYVTMLQTLLNGKAKPLAVQYNVKCVQDVIAEYDSLCKDFEQYLKAAKIVVSQ